LRQLIGNIVSVLSRAATPICPDREDSGFPLVCAAIGTILFILAWPAKALGYKEQRAVTFARPAVKIIRR